jgi:hypothetical protein
MEEYLIHHGILGMKWGIRRYQNKDGSLTSAGKRKQQKEQKRISDAERILGRKLKWDDTAGDASTITKRDAKKIKKVDELEKRYKAVKKKGDPDFDWMRGYHLDYGVSLGNKRINNIIKKIEKKPEVSAMKMFQIEKDRAYKAKIGKTYAEQFLKTAGSIGIAYLLSKKIYR